MTAPVALLAVRIGNDHSVLGLLDRDGPTADGRRVNGRGVLADWRVASDERRTPDEWRILLRALLRAGPDVEVDGVALCSAVPAIQRTWREMVLKEFPDVPHVFVEPGTRTGIPVRVDNPREVGADRIVNAIAAADIAGGPAVVVDFGTATTLDVLNAKGEYVGGAIAPGIETSLDALRQRGAQLRKVELRAPRSVVAKNTVEALQSGLLYGAASQVDGLVARIARELGIEVTDLSVLATGPLAPLVVAECETVTAHDPWLTLHGLRRVFERNV
ncbi:type III pantothenate kinase [Nocardioides bigeumensis]|uniref:Type III pantothenate kinase n=1 Tax=Nocardioides bigeumensis TaxID=433657 RepID=A0ABP5KKH3_9ACTN